MTGRDNSHYTIADQLITAGHSPLSLLPRKPRAAFGSLSNRDGFKQTGPTK